MDDQNSLNEGQKIPVRVESISETPLRRKRGRPKGSKKAFNIEGERPSLERFSLKSPSFTKPPSQGPYRAYQRIALGFSLLSLALLGVVVYFSPHEARLLLISKRFPVSTTFGADLRASSSSPLPQNTLTGAIVHKVGEATRAFTTSTQNVTVSKASGLVIIINTFSKDQALVINTRLLTPSGVLFRIQKAVLVPANGKVENVPVRADKEGSEGAIPPSRFTIPGLWSGLQDKIYAESTAPMKGGTKELHILTQEDLARAKKTLEEEVAAVALKNLETEFGKPLLTIQDITTSRSDTKIGTETATFNYTVTLEVVGIIFDKNALLTLGKKNLETTLASDPSRALAKTNEPSLTYFLESYDIKKQAARLKTYLEGESIWAASSPFLAKEKIQGLSKQAAEVYFRALEGISSAKLTIYPFWLKTLPSDPVKITLEVQ